MIKQHLSTTIGIILIGLTLLVTACSSEIPPISDSGETLKKSFMNTQVLPQAFTANGSEPFWNMQWNDQVIIIKIGLEKKKIILKDVKILETKSGWLLTSGTNVAINLNQTQCLDLAGNPNNFEIDANVSNVRLVGCGNYNS